MNILKYSNGAEGSALEPQRLSFSHSTELRWAPMPLFRGELGVPVHRALASGPWELLTADTRDFFTQGCSYTDMGDAQ